MAGTGVGASVGVGVGTGVGTGVGRVVAAWVGTAIGVGVAVGFALGSGAASVDRGADVGLPGLPDAIGVHPIRTATREKYPRIRTFSNTLFPIPHRCPAALTVLGDKGRYA